MTADESRAVERAARDCFDSWFDGDAVDLVYLDPPLNSNSDYNVIFKDESGKRSDASMKAFDSTWHA